MSAIERCLFVFLYQVFKNLFYCEKSLPRFDERVLVKEEESPVSDDYKDQDQGDHQGAAENRLFISTKIIQHLITLK
jgi:hypothetical protein